MNLCIVSNKNLDEMEKVVAKLFSDIKDKNLNEVSFKDIKGPQSNTSSSQIVKIVPIKDIDSMTLKFLLPRMYDHMLIKPLSYFSHLIGHESKNSILAFLIEEGLATEISAGGSDFKDYFSQFTISINLTKKGLNEWDKIVMVIGQYIMNIREKGVQEWIWKEIKDFNSMEFKFRNFLAGELDSAVDLAGSLDEYSFENILLGGHLYKSFEPELMQQVAEQLIPENCRITIVSKDFEGKTTKTDKIYGTCYDFEPMPEEIKQCFLNPELASWTTSNLTTKDLDFPEPNVFLPKNFDIIHTGEKILSGPPTKLRDDEKVKLYYALDTEFLKPKFGMQILLRNCQKFIIEDPKMHLYCILFVRELKHYLRDQLYQADLAGLEFNISLVYQTTFNLGLSGYNNSFEKFMEFFLNKLEPFLEYKNEKRFDNILKGLIKDEKNSLKKQPYQIGFQQEKSLCMNNCWSADLLAEKVDELNFVDFCDFKKQIFKKIKLEIVIEGNVAKDVVLRQVENITSTFERVFSTDLQKEKTVEQLRIVCLPHNKVWINEKVLMVPDEKNCCFISTFQIGADIRYKVQLFL